MNLEYEKDNKERIPLEHYTAEYAKKDPAEISRRTGFPYLEQEQVFLITFFGKEYRIGFPEFSVQPVSEEPFWSPLEELAAAKILVIRYLSEGTAMKTTGKFVTYREIPWGEVYYRQFNGRCMMRLAFSYGNRPEAFQSALEAMGAQAVKAGDRGYQFEVFPGYFVQFLIWEGDDEFPPSSQILFSDNFSAAFHGEDLVVVCDIAITTMKNQ